MSYFKIRTSLPESGNKLYNNASAGGYSRCITGSPTRSGLNVLSNCVGWSCSRFNEIYNEITGYKGMKFWQLNCNAENFIERAKSVGLEVVSYPVLGGIMVWQRGNTLSGSDGAGHVEVVEDIYNSSSIYTSASNYGGTTFYNARRSNSNGRWGLGSAYKFRGCIVNPAVGKITTSNSGNNEPTDNTNGYTGKFKIGDKVIINGNLYISSKAVNPSGTVSNKTTIITRVAENTAHPYNTTGDLGWINENDIRLYEESKPDVKPDTSLKVGDKVKIVGTGNGSSYGTSNTAYGIGWEREILKVWTGRKYPYQVGNSTGTTGFYQESALQKI